MDGVVRKWQSKANLCVPLALAAHRYRKSASPRSLHVNHCQSRVHLLSSVSRAKLMV